ncbi:MAG: response regulator [Naasia sp.]|nr:response regulator [Naasia sp.]
MPQALVADDDALVRYVLRCALEQRGYIVHEAANGAELIGGLSTDLDLIFMDGAMPGPPLAARLDAARLLVPAACVIVMSGTTAAPAEAVGAGAAYLAKPVGLAELDAELERFGCAVAGRVR